MAIDRRLVGKAARRAAVGAGILLLAVWLLALRPQALGGPAGYITVSGVSMEPALHAGDLVVLMRAEAYKPGDVVAYRVPDGDPAAGRHVIHRVIGGGPEEGYVLQGDNTEAPDRWRPTARDVVGRQVFVIPAFGSALMLLKTPAALGGLATALMVFALPQWSGPGGAGVSTRRSWTLRRLAGARGTRPEVVTLNQAILIYRLDASGACTAQILVEFQNVGTESVEMNAAMSTYSTTGDDGTTTARGVFSSVHPLRVAPGERGYMLTDIDDLGVRSDELVAVSSVIACRDARPSAADASRRRPWQLLPG